MQTKDKKKHSPIGENIAYVLVRLALPVVSRLPLGILYPIARAIGAVAYKTLHRDRERAILNLRLAFGDRLSARRLHLIVRGMFLHLAMMAAECLNLYGNPSAKKIFNNIGVEGLEILTDALDKGKGLVIFTAHYGNWEYLAIRLYRGGHAGLTGLVLSRKLRSEKFQRIVKMWRERLGVMEWHTDSSPKALINCLRRNVCIGVLNDQDISRAAGIFVDFFGIPAFTPALVSDLSYRCQSPLGPCLAVRRKNRTHVIKIFPVIAPREEEKKEDYILRSQQEYAALLEKMIRRHPSQWVWFHRRWKTRPYQVNAAKYPTPSPTP